VKYCILLFLVVSFCACDFDKISKVYIENNNDYPISIELTTLNITQTYGPVEAKGDLEDWFTFTDINLEDGRYVLKVTHHNTGRVQPYASGNYHDGDLGNYFHFISEGNDLKVHIDF